MVSPDGSTVTATDLDESWKPQAWLVEKQLSLCHLSSFSSCMQRPQPFIVS